MKEYKRLSNNNLEEYNPEYDFCMGCKYFGEPNGCNRPNGTCGNYERFIETYNRLAELEDKIENGTLVELPCKVGDWLFYVYENTIQKAKVEEILYGITKCDIKNPKITIYAYDFKNKIELTYHYEHNFSAIYKKTAVFVETFLTKAEAEAKLKELKKEV